MYINESEDSSTEAMVDRRFFEFGLQDGRIVRQGSATLRQ